MNKRYYNMYRLGETSLNYLCDAGFIVVAAEGHRLGKWQTVLLLGPKDTDPSTVLARKEFL